jgi:hypothetical protein
MQRRLEPIAKTNHNKSTNSLGTNEIAGNFNVSKNLNEFDCTSIASISESSHWSGNNDDLDNIALGTYPGINFTFFISYSYLIRRLPRIRLES